MDFHLIWAKEQNLKSLKALETWVSFGDVGLLTNFCFHHYCHDDHVAFYIQSVKIQLINNQIVLQVIDV